MNKQFTQEWGMSGRDVPTRDVPAWNAPVAIEPRPPASPGAVVAHKQIVTIRLDADMLDWFKGAGPGYQTRINQILRQHMADQRIDGGRPSN